MEKKINYARLLTMLCAIPALGLLICQFVPFWSLGDEKISINRFIWFCFEHGNFETYFQQVLGDKTFSAGSIVGANVLTLFGCLLGIIFCIKNPDEIWPLIFPFIGGMASNWSINIYPVYRMGFLWPIHLVVANIVCDLAIAAFVFHLIHRSKSR